jgi:hypothetical protein
MPTPPDSESKGIRYKPRLSLATLAVFVISLVILNRHAQQADAGIGLKLAAALIPFGAWLAHWWLAKREFDAANDERARHITTAALAIAFPVSLSLIMLLGILHQLGLGLLPPETFWMVGALAQFLGLEIARRRYQ